jgi:DNA-binding NarL/FixJ family response regulator
MFRVFILDDEQSAITLLKHKLSRNFPEEVEIIGTSDNPLEALKSHPRTKTGSIIYRCRHAASDWSGVFGKT